MKKYISFFFILLFLNVSAQSYKNICTPGISTFHSAVQNEYKCLRFDTVQPLPGNDTVFISYQMVRPNGYECGTIRGGSLLGPRVKKLSTGWVLFFNKNGDTLSVNTAASLNGTWKFCNLSGGNYLQASITALATDTMMGVSDSVKVITFQAKNSSGQNIAHGLNQKQVKLSKHYGLSLLMDMYVAPDTGIFYSLIGKSQPAVGFQEATWRDIFNFDVGDEFHYKGYLVDHTPNLAYNETKLIIRTILDKTTGSANSSYQYTIQYCEKDILQHAPTGWYSYNYYSYNYGILYDSTTVANSYPGLTDLPDQLVPIPTGNNGHPGISWNRNYLSRKTKQVIHDYYFEDINPDCWIQASTPTYHVYNFADGLGQTVDSIPIVWDNIVGYTSGPYEHLVYYKKGVQTWGSPVAYDCSSLLGTGEALQQHHTGLTVISNPVHDKGLIRIDSFTSGERYTAILSDLSGKVQWQEEVRNNPFIFERKGLSSGVYILQVKNQNTILEEKVILD